MDSAKRQGMQEADARKRVKSSLGSSLPVDFTSLIKCHDKPADDNLGDMDIVEFVASQAIMEMTPTPLLPQDMVCMRLNLHPTVVKNLTPESVGNLELLGLRELEFSLLKPPVVLGRELFHEALSSDQYDSKAIEINKLSRKHCELECVQDPRFHRPIVRLTNLSTNGIKYNGVSMVKNKPQMLHHGDKITLLSSKSGTVLLGYICEEPYIVGASAAASATHGDSSKHHIEANILDLDLSRVYDSLTKALDDAASHAITKPDDPSVMLVPREINLNVQFATLKKFDAMVTLGCRALHFAGHGGPKHLYFEDQECAVHPLDTDELRRFFLGAQRQLRLVVVQAVHSDYSASAFLACCVPHVITVKTDKPSKDEAVIAFTKNFYLALGQGKGVADSFNFALEAISKFPQLAHAAKVAALFRLLPEGVDHSEVIFPMVETPLAEYKPQAPSAERFPAVWCTKLPLLCQHFLHRKVDLHYTCAHFASTKLKVVWLVGPAGVGKSQLSYATARHLRARNFFLTGIKFVYVGKLVEELLAAHNNNAVLVDKCLMVAIKNRVAVWLARLFGHARPMITVQDALLVLDGIDPLLEREDAAVLTWIESLCMHYAPLRLLVTARKQVVSPIFETGCGCQQHLHPFSATQAVDLLRRLLGKERDLSLTEVARSPLAVTVNHPDPDVNLSLVLERHPVVLQTGFLPREIAVLASRLIATPKISLDALLDHYT
ncbi:hypothetical protein ACHHYP_16871 [Achlya hypogyna]|uniref:FHA domain-containing protein n=1 Tax=Achlya hypogyna TaxID=1202772 RepID=A0A1V9Y5L5_ACHHY|nr:hypothetical protein ACHHYP_16871 [Achlya hypogyna]